MERIKITAGTIFFFFFLVLGTVVAFYSIHVLIIAFIGILLGILLSPAMDSLQQRFSLSRGISAGIVIVVITGLFALICFSLYYLISDQLEVLFERLPEFQSRLHELRDQALERFPWIEQQKEAVTSKVPVQKGIFKIFSGLKIGMTAIAGGLFIVIIGLYTSYYSPSYTRALHQSIPPKFRHKAISVLNEITAVLRRWFKAQLTDMAIIGVITSIGLWICGLEYWAVFGLLTGVMGIIPYIGILFVVTAAALVTIASDPGKLPWVLTVFFVTQQLEGNVIIPLLMRDKVSLPVVPLLLFMLFLGNFLGVIGVFVSPPMFAILKTIYDRIYIPYIEKYDKIAT